MKDQSVFFGGGFAESFFGDTETLDPFFQEFAGLFELPTACIVQSRLLGEPIFEDFDVIVKPPGCFGFGEQPLFLSVLQFGLQASFLGDLRGQFFAELSAFPLLLMGQSREVFLQPDEFLLGEILLVFLRIEFVAQAVDFSVVGFPNGIVRGGILYYPAMVGGFFKEAVLRLADLSGLFLVE